QKRARARMSEMNYNSFLTPQPAEAKPAEAPQVKPGSAAKHAPIGKIVGISGRDASVQMDRARLREIAGDPDPTVALSGQVGCQIKLAARSKWLLAHVRTLLMDDASRVMVSAEIDFP